MELQAGKATHLGCSQIGVAGYAYRYDRQPVGLRDWCSKVVADAIVFSAAAARDNSGGSFTATTRSCYNRRSRFDSLECRLVTEIAWGTESVGIGRREDDAIKIGPVVVQAFPDTARAFCDVGLRLPWRPGLGLFKAECLNGI